MTAAWHRALIIPLCVTLILLIGGQAAFLLGSAYKDAGYGAQADTASFANYARILGDWFYWRVLWTSVSLSAIAATWTVALGFPTAYVLARSRARWAMAMLALILLSAFVTIAIKIYGLMIIFQGNGILNRALIAIGIVDDPVTLIGTRFGVVVGLSYFSFGFAVMLLFAVVRTVPRSLEEAAAAHGAGRVRTLWRVVLPLCWPGLVTSLLTVFNLCMGAFTSAALLGAGRVLTLPVLIERTILTEVRYGLGGALAVLLMACVLAVNIASAVLVRRRAA